MYLPRFAQRRLEMLMGAFPAVGLVGARQVGKSTLAKAYLGSRGSSVVFDPVIDVQGARADPELFLANQPVPALLDEVQYAAELLGALKRRIDADRRPGQYILTGSQQWGVLKSVSESLAGRIAFVDAEGFCLAELASPQSDPWLLAWLSDPKAFLAGKHRRLNLPHALFELLWRGFLPDAALLPLEAVAAFHQAYQRTYIERDARVLADVMDWQQFGRFTQLVAALSAREVNLSQLGREIGVTPQTSRRWREVLKAIFQWHEVPAYEGNTIKRLSSRPKGYFDDSGVVCAALAISSPSALPAHPHWGMVFETAVYAELRKALALLPYRPNVYHWRTHGGAEVDLIVERDAIFYPIEVKSHSRPTRADARGIAAFRETYPKASIAPGLVICPCEAVTQLTADDWAVPWDCSL